MKIVVNGKELDVKEDITVLELLNELKIKDKVMAVAINMNIVKKDKWDIYKISNADKVELLHFVGGG
jgi:sulfur carrier protein